MSNRLFLLSTAAAALIVAAPALASAQSVAYKTTSPVALASFRINESYSSGMIGGELAEAPQFLPGGVTLKFVNTTAVPVTAVKFTLSDGSYMQRIIDKGTFSPGINITHTFAVDGSARGLQNATCTVSEVDFADGRTWLAEEPLPNA